MTEATNLMKKAAAALFPEAVEEQHTFLAALLDPVPRSSAVVWTVPRREGEFDTVERGTLPSWIPDAVELVKPGEKIGRSRAYEAGEVYPLDFSSVTAASGLLATEGNLPPEPRVLDLCAAPGGKSILASILVRPGLLLANEVEGKRLGPLRHNLTRCGIPNAYTQRLMPEEIARLAPEAFDLCLVDAPCSGQSLLAKGVANPGCFHPSTIKGNARRQLRILEAAAATVAPGGFLLYTTCTFSERENEGVVAKWLERSGEGFAPVEVTHLEPLRSPLADFPCYRIYPHNSHGVGGFAALLRREGIPDSAPHPPLPAPLLDYPVGPAAALSQP